MKCCELTVGASDVAGETFGQYTEGSLLGHRGGAWTVRNVRAIDTTGMISHRPLVVPFAFFAYKGLAKNPDMVAGDPNNMGYDPNNVINLTRLQAVLIFSRITESWSDFLPVPPWFDPSDPLPPWWPRPFPWPPVYYPEKTIIACLRHAGSGTHATLDAAVMRQDTWPLATTENYTTFFNDGSSDMMKCINENGGYAGTEYDDYIASIGYADADQSVGPNTSYPNVYQLMYQGAPANKHTIANGIYDFWSAQWLYECWTRGVDPYFDGLLDEFFDYADSHLPSSKANFWANQSEMNVEKASDRGFPKFI